MYYLVDNEQYICQKINDYNYKIIVEENNWNSLNWVIRIIRELYLREKEDRKYYFMHGTALEFNNKGILLLGASGSGKTTLAVKMLELEEYKRFLSNDRVLIDKNKNLEYFPRAVTYAMGTVKNNKDLDKYFRENRILEKKRKIKYEDAPYDMDCNTPLNDIEKVFQHTDMTAKTTLEEQIESLKLAHMNKIEIRKINDKYLWEFTEEELKEFKKILDKEDIEVLTIDSPVGKKPIPYSRKVELFDIYLNICKIFDSKILRIFSNLGKEINEDSIKIDLHRVCEKAEKNVIK